MHPVHEARAHEHKNAMAHLKRAGYKHGGAVEVDRESDKRMVRRAVRQHEEHDHKGEKLTDLKLRKGGKVEGHKTKARHDRKYANGGHVKHHSKGGAKTNIVIATGGGEGERRMAMQQGVQIGARLAGAGGGAPMGVPPVPPRPPMAAPPGPPPGMAPPGMGAPPPGLPPRPPMKRGGRTRMHDEWSEREQHEKRGGRAVKRQFGGYAPMGRPQMGRPAMGAPQAMPMGRPMGAAQPGGGAPMVASPSVGAAPPMSMGVGTAGPATVSGDPRMPMKRGGFALKDAGAGGAKGRMEKEKAYGHGGATHVKVRSHMRRKAGGRIERDCG